MYYPLYKMVEIVTAIHLISGPVVTQNENEPIMTSFGGVEDSCDSNLDETSSSECAARGKDDPVVVLGEILLYLLEHLAVTSFIGKLFNGSRICVLSYKFPTASLIPFTTAKP